MKVRSVMTREPVCVMSWDSALVAGKLMLAHDVGALPVVSDTSSMQLEGIVTDRDLCRTVIAAGRDPEFTTVEDAMTPHPVTCWPDDTLEDCERLMQQRRVRRIPVVDDSGALVGIVSQADIARYAGAEKVRQTLLAISTPPLPSSKGRGAA